jgi:hypothetical protein
MKTVFLSAVILLVAVQSWAFDPSGKYLFIEKGMGGGMDISESGQTIKLRLDTVSPQTNLCDLEATGSRVISSDKSITTIFVVNDDAAEKTKFEVKFTPKGAVIKMLETGSPVCGRDAYFDGKWTKEKAAKKKKK